MHGPAARLVIGGVAVAVIVLAVVLWPRQKPAPQVASSPPTDITPVPTLPPGAMQCRVVYPEVTTPFNAGARGTPMTSCGFVEQVRRAYAEQAKISSRVSQLSVISPSTRMEYNLACFDIDHDVNPFATCTGGQGAIIYLYNK